MWLPPGLLLLCLPGCLSLTGPSCVSGTVGSSLTVQCQYDSAYKGNRKYWCRQQHNTDCNLLVETQGEEKEKRNGRVSIRDSSDNCTFTVTMKNLKEADAGSYWCKIQTVWLFDAWSRDPSFQVQVSVYSAPSTTLTIPRGTTAATSLAVNFSTNYELSRCPGVPLSIIHFLFLISLKLPLLLSVLAAVVCVSRRERAPGERPSQPDQGSPPCTVRPPGVPCLGIQPFRLDKGDLRTLHCRAGKP